MPTWNFLGMQYINERDNQNSKDDEDYHFGSHFEDDDEIMENDDSESIPEEDELEEEDEDYLI